MVVRSFLCLFGEGGGVRIFNSFSCLFPEFFSARKVNLGFTPPSAQLRVQADMCSSNTNYSLCQTPLPQPGSVIS